MFNDKKVREQLGQRLKTAREKKKLTQLEVAKLAHIHVNYYARLERGEEDPSLETLRQLGKILNVTIQL